MSVWIKWVNALHAIAQNGLTFSKDKFDIVRYHEIRGIANEMLSTISEVPAIRIEEVMIKNLGYATPKLDIRGAVFKDNKILLVKEISDQKWSLPGGWADINASPTEMVIREVFEESGFIVSVQKLIAVFDKYKQPHPLEIPHAYKMFFLCRLEGGEATPSIETSEVDFFAIDSLPPLSTPRVTTEQISTMFKHYSQPDLPTEFD